MRTIPSGSSPTLSATSMNSPSIIPST
ncbi:hypothetical protein CCOS01_09479 [Colletotrichum costaricense]|uniref:Uncharacterized protein n=1 Tax=Colletotrichum costaricense TaxID=1209916 RepID=A0AAI9YVH0_9PEZI|nr:hypothetical protein CCOS01_09479 [Colletotrichum costaricense]